jgi:uncharacterized protein YjbJ (UPF0337 family)
MSFDFGSVDFEAGDVASDVEVNPDNLDYGSETLADSSDQVGDFAGNSDFVDATDPSSITDAPGELAGGDFVGPPEPSAFGNAVDSLKDQAGSLADKAKDAASGAFDKIKASAESTLTKLESQFSAKNIEAFATKTAKSLVTQVENTAINLAKQTANKALSTVVGPAAAASLTNAATRSLTGPSTPSAKTVSSSVDPSSPSFVGPPAPSNTSPADAPSGYQNEAQQNADGNGGNVTDAPAATNAGASTTTNANGSTTQTFDDGSTITTAADGKITSTPAPTNDGASIRTNTDGSTTQTFDDGSTLTTGTDGKITSTPAPVDNPNAANGTIATGNNLPTNNAPGVVADPNLATLPSITNTALGSIANAATAAINTAAGGVQGLIRQAQNQQTARAQTQTKAQAGDWRVRLSLAPNSNYLYNATDCGPVLYPLYNTQGVIFPYTPSIDLGYKANYTQYDLTHSNYRGYFYQSSYVDGINVKGTFTAQDTTEANYLLAVIHFFRSVTKMFYGQDAQAGSPPPLVFLSGLGDFQFNQHPCVVSQFNYSLPSDVNYIRAQTVANSGTNQISARTRQTTLNPISNAIQRLASLGQGIQPGALAAPFATQGSLSGGNPTYVPTKMDINITLLPIQSRQQVSQQFSLKGFANGNLLKGGFW